MLQEKTGKKLDQKIKSHAQNERADALGPNFLLESNRLPLEKKESGPTQSQQIMTNGTDPRIWHENACPFPRE